MRAEDTGEKRKGQSSEVPGSRRKDVAGETPREANEKKIVEPSKEERRLYTRRSEVAEVAEAATRKDTGRMKPRLGLENDAVKFM